MAIAWATQQSGRVIPDSEYGGSRGPIQLNGPADNIENLPSDSRLYDDIDLLKTSGLIRTMPSTSRPWTRGECARLVDEALGKSRTVRLAPGQRAALKRLEFEFGWELHRSVARRSSINIPVPDTPGDTARCNLFSRLAATRDRQGLSGAVVLDNRPSDKFCFYERGELTFYHPNIPGESLSYDSAGVHLPGKRVLPWRNIATFDAELAYLAIKLPWVRLELGRDDFVWGPGYTGSVMLNNTAPALDHVQLCASYRNFKFLSLNSFLSRWGTTPRFLSAQRVEVSLLNHVTLGGAMMVVSSWDSLQPTQLGGLINPLIPVYLSESNSADWANLLMGCDAVAYLPRTKVYGQLFLDNYEFNTLKLAPDAYGAQAGAYWAPNLPVEARIEYTRITAFTYYHRVHSIMYENYLTPLGHSLGPDADQLCATFNVVPNGWLKILIGGDYTRRGYHNRGDYLRKSYKDPQDTLYLRQHDEFPTRGWDTLADTVTEEVDKTIRFSPGIEVQALRDLFVSLTVGLWHSQNYQGAIGLKKDGVDLALKVEYRY